MIKTKSERHGRNIIITDCDVKQKFLMISDVHFDNPKCKRNVLKRHLDYARENEMKVAINGDFFCLMQGKYDPRRSKKDILPAHNSYNYLDLVIEEAVDWWSPYADMITFIGYGNHETAIIKNTETDPLRRFVDLLNYKNKTSVLVGGYGGWWIIRPMNKKGSAILSTFKIKYFHGSGGGGEVTKGVIQNNRMSVRTEGADCTWQGHVHELYHVIDSKEYIQFNSHTGYSVQHKYLHHIRTACYKEEYEDGYAGYHIEKGRPPKPIGGYILSFDLDRSYTETKREWNLVPNFEQIRDK
jgi:hypothetical protein